MKSIIVALLGITFSGMSAYADINLVGPKPRTLAFREGLGLIEILAGVDMVTCSNVHVKRGDAIIAVALRSVLDNFGNDWPLKDGDIIFMPEHVFPCLNEGDSDRFVQLINEWNDLKISEATEPSDWRNRVAKLPTHIK